MALSTDQPGKLDFRWYPRNAHTRTLTWSDTDLTARTFELRRTGVDSITVDVTESDTMTFTVPAITKNSLRQAWSLVETTVDDAEVTWLGGTIYWELTYDDVEDDNAVTVTLGNGTPITVVGSGAVALAAEAAARAAGDATNATAIAAEATARAAAVTAEASSRTTADAVLASAITTETTRATTAEAAKETPAGAQAKADAAQTAATAAAAALVDDLSGVSNPSAALTNLGVSTFAKTVLDDVDAAAVRSTIGAQAAGTSVQLAGDTMSGDLAMDSHRVTGLADPAAAQDAATQAYVLDQLDGFDIHALNHGIVADGVTDDTAAWKALIEPGGIGAGKSVYFPPKRVSIISDDLLPAHNTTVGNKSFGIVIDGVSDYGTGATFRWKSGTSGVGKYMWNCLNREGVHLRGVNFDGQFTASLEAVLWDSTNSPANQWCSIENFQIAKIGTDGGTDGVAIHAGRSTVTNYQCDKNRIRFGYILHVGRGIVTESANASDEMIVESVALQGFNIGIDVVSCGPLTFKAITFGAQMLGANPACIQVAAGNNIVFETVQAEGISTGTVFFRVPASASPDATNPVTFINCNAACAATNPATLGLIMDIQATKRIVGVGNHWGGNIKLAGSAMYLQMGDTFVNPNGAQARSIIDGRTVSGGPSLTSPTAAFTYADVGQKAIGQFAAIPAATTITAVVTATTAAAWQATHDYVLGDLVRPTAANSHLYMCTTAGTTGGAEPTWVTGGTTNTDGSVVWQDCGLATGATLSANATGTVNGNMGATFEMGVLLASVNCDHLNLTPFANSSDPAVRIRSQRALGLLVEAVGNSTAATITLDNRITAASGKRYQIQVNGSSFFIRDINSGTIPFQIQTGVPTNAVIIAVAGITLGLGLTIGSGKDLIMGTAALATTATAGFPYIPTCAGTPTGVPTAHTGTVPLVYDTTNHKLYVYDGGWKTTTVFA